jgi:hypothetical protein
MPVRTKAPDLLRRFTPTSLVAHTRVMERTIRLESNSPIVIEYTRRALGTIGEAPAGKADCLWRVVTEAGFDFKATWPEMIAFSNQDLVFINLEQRGFLAADLGTREAVAFVAEELVNDELGFRRPFLAMLFSITAPCLRLLPVMAACVALGPRGLLIFGPPRSGKSTSACLAGGLGLKFHADQVVFLDAEGEGLRAWGEFWPALFYQETSFPPADVAAIAQPFYDGRQTYLYLDSASRLAGPPHAVTPTCCIFLEARDSQPLRLLPLGRAELAARLNQYCLFDKGQLGDASLDAALNRLQGLPAYRLAYEGDCAAAAIILRSLLKSQELFAGL